MEEYTLESGLTIRCMAKVDLHGSMADLMKEAMQPIKSKDLEFLFGKYFPSNCLSIAVEIITTKINITGLMGKNILENGLTGSSMVTASMNSQMVKDERENGGMANE